jgi:hypothetical protein
VVKENHSDLRGALSDKESIMQRRESILPLKAILSAKSME